MKALIRIAVMVVGVGTLGLTGCARTGIDQHNIAYAAYDAEYQEAKGSLTLPQGMEWPPHVRKPPPNMGEATYEKGAGVTDAQFYWMCNWAHAYLNSSSDPAAASAALAELRKVKSMLIWTDGIDDQLRTMINQALAEAELGGSATWLQLFGREKCVI